nr:hypothetical protein BaRGS_032631 [Batillaria attramentaria]
MESYSRKRIIIHEVGHALGLHHEQTRPDREGYVSIISRNIAPSTLYNFQRYSWRTIQNYNVDYDYYSIMHYGKTGRHTKSVTEPEVEEEGAAAVAEAAGEVAEAAAAAEVAEEEVVEEEAVEQEEAAAAVKTDTGRVRPGLEPVTVTTPTTDGCVCRGTLARQQAAEYGNMQTGSRVTVRLTAYSVGRETTCDLLTAL